MAHNNASDLLERITGMKSTDALPGIPARTHASNPLLEAYDTHPQVRSIVHAGRRPTRDDVVHNRLSPDTISKITRYLYRIR